MKLSIFILGAIVMSLAASAGPASAQSITMTGPSSTVTVQEGDDYASTQLQNPWDFNQRRDIGWEENFIGTSVAASGGIWSGTNQTAGGYVLPLFGGFFGGLFAEGPAGDQEVPRLGVNHPLDTSRYSMVAYRLRHTSPSAFAIYWNNNVSATNWPTGANFGSSFDGYYDSAGSFRNTGFNVRYFNMKNLAGSFEARAGSWSGNVYALRLDPSNSGPAGSTTSIDWIRVVDPASAPNLTVSWSSAGLNANRVMTVYVDTVNTGYNGSPLARYTYGNDPGRHTFPTAMLPPGDYYFYVTATSGAGQTLLARSGYSARLRVTRAPNVVFGSPTELSGDDYAATVIGNPWDMSDSADISNLAASQWPYEWRQFSSPSFVNGIFQAVADLPLYNIGNQESDVQLHMNVPPGKPIDTSKYRYLTYRMAVDAAQYPTISDKVRDGWVSRPVFWNVELFADGGRPKAHTVYEGYKTYTIDLWNNSIMEWGQPWRTNRTLQHLRIDPLETHLYTWFWFDWVKLTAQNRSASGVYPITFSIEDGDSSSFTASLYYDTDKSGFDGRLITALSGLRTGYQSYNWNTSSLPTGAEYYVYVVVSDGSNTRRFYAPAPVSIGAYTPAARLLPPAMDYDGDGKSDTMIYRPGEVAFYIRRSLLGPMRSLWGSPTSAPIHGDFDGDGRADIGTIVSSGRSIYWYILRSSDQQIYHRVWGYPGDKIVPADYNGDGADDIAVFRNGVWYVLYANNTSSVVGWGNQPGDIPVPGDYDDDGKADVAIFRPNTGEWWILYSGYPASGTPNYYTGIQWGLPGDIPVPADYDGDGRTDTVVWRPREGNWYLRSSISGRYAVTQWGLPGDKPLAGDFNGDGLLDLTVFRPGQANWYHNFRNGQAAVTQWGLPGDLLPLNRER